MSIDIEIGKDESKEFPSIDNNTEDGYFDDIENSLDVLDNIDINNDNYTSISTNEEDFETDSRNPYARDLRQLPKEWKKHYHRVVWAQTSKSFPWWPSFIYDPEDVDVSLLKPVTFGKKHILYHYGSNDYGYASLDYIKDYEEFRSKYASGQKIQKKYIKHFEKALELADSDVLKDVEDRVSWNHVITDESKSKKRNREENISFKAESKKVKKADQKENILETTPTEEELDDSSLSVVQEELELDNDDYVEVPKESKDKARDKKILKKNKILKKSDRELLEDFVKELIKAKTDNLDHDVITIIKKLKKLKNLTVSDFLETKSNELVKELRKHSNNEVVKAATDLKNHWIQVVNSKESETLLVKVKSQNQTHKNENKEKSSKQEKEEPQKPIQPTVIRGSVPLLKKTVVNSSHTVEDVKEVETKDDINIPESVEINETNTNSAFFRKPPINVNSFGSKKTLSSSSINPIDDFSIEFLPDAVRNSLIRTRAVRLLHTTFKYMQISCDIENEIYQHYQGEYPYSDTVTKLTFALQTPALSLLRQRLLSRDPSINYAALCDYSVNELKLL